MIEYTKAEQAIRNIQNLFPSDMIKRPQWVAWRSVRKPGDEKPTKVPIDSHNGDEAKTNDPKTWASCERAARRYIANEGYAGIGYVFTKDDPYGGIDLDNCRDPNTGEIAEWAERIIRSAGTYAEISPSGTGVKLYGLGTVPGGGRKWDGHGVEMYSRGRWFAVTGEQIEGTPSETRDIQTAIDVLLAKLDGERGTNGSGLGSPQLDIAHILDGVEEGGRDNALYSYACSLESRHLHLEEAVALARMAAENAKPPFDPALAEEKIRRVFGKYRRNDSGGRAGDPELISSGHIRQGRARTDLGNAERLAERISGKAVYVYEATSWYTFTGKRWEPDTTGAIYRHASDTVRGIYAEAEGAPDESTRKETAKWAMASETKTRLDAMVKLATTIEGMAVSAAIFDSNPYILACNNGTIDLRTGELRLSRPEDYISKLAPVDWSDLDTFAPRWSKFLAEIFPEPELRDYMRVAAGYGATGLSNARAFFICHGSGRNGKGTFLETVRDVLGDYGHTAKPETFLESRREGGAASTDVASLKGARLVVTSETKRGAKIDTNLVKSLTGDDKINARHLFERPIEFKPSWSVFVATNHKPEMPGDDVALWERVKLVPFDVRISDKEKDTGLKDKLMAEAPGILAWIVSGAMVYIEHGLQDPPAVREATNEYQTESDPIGDFIANYLEIRPGDDDCYVAASDLQAAWSTYCEQEQVTGVRYKDLPARLKSQYGKTLINQKTKKIDRNAVRAWIGLALNDAGEDLVYRYQAVI